MKNKTLFGISEDLHALYDLLSDTDGDVSDESTEQAIEEWFKEIETDQNKKVDGYCELIDSLESLACIRKNKAAELSKSAKILENKASRLKDRLYNYMIINDMKKIVTDLHNVTIANNGGKAPLKYPETWDDDPASAPEAYHRRVIKIDLETLRLDLESGVDVDGCYIEPRGKHIRIK